MTRACQRWIVWLACSGCALVTPLDSVTQSTPRDAGHDTPERPKADSGVARAPTMSTPAPCQIAPGADCNPSQRCGCPGNSRCALDESIQRVRCLEPRADERGPGAVCTSTSECAAGLECSGVKICSPYCESDADCDAKGKCLSFLNEDTMSDVPGASACSRWCDPFSAQSCLELTGCIATGAMSRDTTASCRAIRLLDTTSGAALGEPCDSIFDCARGLTCAEYGPRVCTHYCRSDTDCSGSTPHCYLEDTISAPNEPIGQCIVWPCDDSTLPGPPAWSRGPVWSSAQFEACKLRCGQSPDCYRTSACDDGARWGACIDVALAACAGAPSGPCRKEYLRSTCCAVLSCEPDAKRFVACQQGQADCMLQAERVCAAQ